MNVQTILSEELTVLQSDIIARHQAAGQVASGKAKAAFEIKATDQNGQLLGVGYSGTLERGRKPGKTPTDFVDILKKWIIAKGLTFKDEKDLTRWANAIKWKIIKEGTKLYRSGQSEDIFTTPINQFNQRMTVRISAFYEQEIINEIFNK